MKLLLLFLLIFSPCRAEDATEMKELAKGLFGSFLTKDISAIGELDMKSILERIEDIDYSTTSDELPYEIVADRSSAFYRTNQVVLKEQVFDEDQDAKKLLAVHETLGALGVQDNDYQKSVYLEVMSGFGKEVIEKVVQDLTMKNEFGQDLYMSTGGASGVSGGGDIITAIFKLKVYKKLLNSTVAGPGWTNPFLRMVQLMAFEPFASDETVENVKIVPFIKGKCTGTNLTGIPLGNHKEVFPVGVKVPSDFLRVNKDKMDEMIIEVSEFIYQLYFVSTFPTPGVKRDEILAECGERQLVAPLGIEEFSIVKRSGGLQPFIDEFSFNCLKKSGHEAKTN